MKVRTAQSADAPTISRLIGECYEVYAQTEGFSRDLIAALKELRVSFAIMEQMIATESVWVAEEPEVLGLVSLSGNELTRLYVREGFHRRGIGRLLFLQAEAEFRRAKCSNFFLGAVALNAGEFYRKMGMRLREESTITQGPCLGRTRFIFEKDLSTN